MNDVNLVLKYRLAGEKQFRFKGASRIKVDGGGALMFYNVHSGQTERLEVSQLQSFSLVPFSAFVETADSALPN